MERGSILLGVALIAVAALAASGTSYFAVRSALTDPSDAGEDPPGNDPGDGAAPAANETPDAWLYSVQPNPPARGDPSVTGTVVAFLTKTSGDANTSYRNGSIPIELAGVTWDPTDVALPPDVDLRAAMNQAFAESPPVALARAALSKNADAVELTVPGALNVRSVVVNAPLSGGFLVVRWPSGESYAWAEEARAWAPVPGLVPTVAALPPT